MCCYSLKSYLWDGAGQGSWDGGGLGYGDWAVWVQELLQTVGSTKCGSYIDPGLSTSCVNHVTC